MTALEPSETVFYNQPGVNYNTTELLTDNFLYIEDNMFSYFHSNDESIEFAGEWADNPTWEYYYYQFQDPEQYFAFPFNYEDSFTDQYLSTGYDMSGTGQHKGWGTRTVVADGFGTLIMPDKTYSNCLRLKATINYSDSSGLWGVEHYTKYQYTWFAPEINGHILDIELGSNLWLLRADYYFNNPLVATRNLSHQNNILLSPNPVSDQLRIQFQQPVKGKVMFIIYSITGMARMKLNDWNPSVLEIPLSEFPSGIYVLEVITSKGSSIQKFVKL